MKNKEIVRALRCCAEPGRECEEDCPMNEISREPCREVLAPAAADLIEKLTDRCARYAEEIAVAQERTRWIPVTERLPELQSWGASTVVLGLIKSENAPSLNKLRDLTLCVYCDNGIWLMPGRYAAITHWMPLPEWPEET